MLWPSCLLVLGLATTANTINKPVYKIALTQKGYAQFLQYDVDTPPLREFTFCTWLRVSEFTNDQSIFTYVGKTISVALLEESLHSTEIGANGNNRVVRLWLDTGGRNAKMSIDEKVFSSVPVDFEKSTWKHICLSYQSDHGAWAVYVDSRLVSCAAAQNVHGLVLPGGGSIIVGYGIAHNGIPNGLEGEIFGVNMILTSTIERNYTIRSLPQYKQQLFKKNKINGHNNFEYIVLDNMKTEKLQKRARPEETSTQNFNKSKSYIKFKTPYSFIEHDVGQTHFYKNTEFDDTSNEKEIMDFPSPDSMRTTNKDKVNFWKLINDAGNLGKFKNNIKIGDFTSETQSLPTISEFETPPPVKSIFDNSVSFIDNKHNEKSDFNAKTHKLLKISDIETPPPPGTSSKVYGQWTSSKFASSVLNYLKAINFHQKEQRRVPSTIPLYKTSDSFPYSSEIKVTKVRPSFKFQRRNFMARNSKKQKRDVKYPEINVKILQDDFRDQIIKSHAQTQPKDVEVTNRGQSLKGLDHRFYRNVDTEYSNEDSRSNEAMKQKSLAGKSKHKFSNSHIYNNHKLLTILPFLKTLEYDVDNRDVEMKEKSDNSTVAYSKSLSSANKWHNVKSYNNDYTPRQINMESPHQNNMQNTIDEANKKLSSVRLKYKPTNQKVEDARIVHARNLASEVSNQSNQNVASVSLIKYNHEILPSHDTKIMSSNNLGYISTTNSSNKNNFNKQVKLGNALNEQNVIGYNEKQNQQSFVGGDETVPDVNRYRSDIDRETGNVPPSLGPRICKNVELYDRLFYVQPDESIDVTYILSPVREKNIGIEFIIQNYKKCSLDNTDLKKSPLLFIDWNRTPVRLFGGAYPKKTTDLCGFF